jgi:arylsulfatase A-like enzyme
MGAPESHLRERPGGIRLQVSAALGAILVTAAGLAVWNLIYAANGSRALREDLSGAGRLLMEGLAAYTLLAGVPILLLSAALRLAAALAPGGGAARLLAERRRVLSVHAGLATGVGAALFAGGILTIRDPERFLATLPSFLNAAVGLLAAVACGWAGGRLMRAGLESARAAALLRRGAGVILGAQIGLLGWMRVRDLLDAGAGSLVGAASAVPALVAGLLLGLGLIELPRFALAGARKLTGSGARRSLLLLAAVLGIAGIKALPRAAVETRPGDLPGIVLIVADSLRADRIGVYGAERVRTPHLDALAGRGARIEEAYAAATGTASSTASILTGLYPGQHGLRAGGDRLSEGAMGIAELLAQEGYRTAAFVTDPDLAPSRGFGRGFDLWESRIRVGRIERHPQTPLPATLRAARLWSPPRGQANAGEVMDRALEWLEGAGGKPFFLYLQLAETRDPYMPPPPYETRYGPPGRAPLRMDFWTLPWITRGTLPVGAEDLERLVALYDGSVSYMDDQIGRLLAELERRGLRDRTLIAFTSTHGEEFIEHGGLGHDRTVYEELVRIPFILSGPGLPPGGILPGPLRQVDIAPTLLEAAGLPPGGETAGRSFWGSLSRGEAAPAREVFVEQTYTGTRSPWHSFRALRQGEFKLIARSFSPLGRGPWEWELYRLTEDPRESRNVADLHPERLAAMQERLGAWLSGIERGVPVESAEEEERMRELRTLGYVE